MIIAEKIMEERKKLGLTQEELAEKLSVSRQAISKWESAQSMPDLQKIILMSELFSVSTDYLLKDEQEPQRLLATETESDRTLRRVSMEEANAFMTVMRAGSKTVSLGVLLCVLCPVTLIVLAGAADAGLGISETPATAVGLAALFIMIATAVCLFLRYASAMEPYGYLEKEDFETAYGVSGLVKEKKAEYEPTYAKYLSFGIILCVLSPLPLILTAVFNERSVLLIPMTGLLLCTIAVGVYLIVRVAMVKSGYQMLLQEGEYSKNEKRKTKAVDAISGVYWSLAVAAYLLWSFLTDNWKFTWILWPVAGVLYAPFSAIVKQRSERKEMR